MSHIAQNPDGNVARLNALHFDLFALIAVFARLAIFVGAVGIMAIVLPAMP
jgi:hypothetical protein